MIKQVGETCGLEVKMENCGSAGIFDGFSCIISLHGNYTRISGDQTEVTYPSGC
jgi:hypothetical protein